MRDIKETSMGVDLGFWRETRTVFLTYSVDTYISTASMEEESRSKRLMQKCNEKK